MSQDRLEEKNHEFVGWHTRQPVSSSAGQRIMTRGDGVGSCEHCAQSFEYMLVHNGFNESAYAYCDHCGQTALLDGWKVPPSIKITAQRPLESIAEHLLQPCPCGGSFKGNAVPRCPKCRQVLSAEVATEWIEAQAPGTKKGWRWQRNWHGIYCIVIDGRLVRDNWRPPERAG